MVLVPPNESGFTAGNQDSTPRLILNESKFEATGERWTIGLPKVREEKASILYTSGVSVRRESFPITDISIIGEVYGVVVNGKIQRDGEQ